MKKTILFVVMALVGFCPSMFAQSSKLHFGSKQNNDAIENWKYVADNNKNDEHDWARLYTVSFPLVVPTRYSTAMLSMLQIRSRCRWLWD